MVGDVDGPFAIFKESQGPENVNHGLPMVGALNAAPCSVPSNAHKLPPKRPLFDHEVHAGRLRRCG